MKAILSSFKNPFRKESKINTPVGDINFSEYKKYYMVSAKDVKEEYDRETLIRHFNKYGEQISETRIGHFPRIEILPSTIKLIKQLNETPIGDYPLTPSEMTHLHVAK